jgi:threonine/homoserine/homoserine lactone efflux protein
VREALAPMRNCASKHAAMTSVCSAETAGHAKASPYDCGMLIPEQMLGFLIAALAITVSPGPDNLMVLGTGVARGRKYGVAFGMGCALGCLSHTVLAVLGVSALLAASPLAFTLLRIAGGLYLVWLGLQALRSTGGGRIEAQAKDARESAWRLFFKGVLANAINPKVVLFFLSFLPQFVIPSNGGVAWQMAALGLLFTAQAALLFGLLGYFAGAVGHALTRRPRVGLWLDRVAGTIFLGLGLRLMVWR